MASLSKPDDLSLAIFGQVFALSGHSDLAAKFRAPLSFRPRRHSSTARSVPIYSAPPATWASKVWCRSAATGLIRRGGCGTGSR